MKNQNPESNPEVPNVPPAVRSADYPSVAAALGRMLQAWKNCKASNNHEWRDSHRANVERIARDLLPSGSGVDRGTSVDMDRSTPGRLVLTLSWHRMDSNGYYCGWYEYRAIVTPTFDGVAIRLIGRNTPEDAKDYLYQSLEYALTRKCRHVWREDTDTSTWEVVGN